MSREVVTIESQTVKGRPVKYRHPDGMPWLTPKGYPYIYDPRKRLPGRFKSTHLTERPGIALKRRNPFGMRGRKGAKEEDADYPIYAVSPLGEVGKRDLWVFASKILGKVYPDLTERLHKPWCEFFVKKDPERYWFLQDPVKQRLWLAPRGHFKTSINLCDIMQWMLAFPDVTIALFSGTEQLTRRMVDEVKQHFLQNGDFRDMYPSWVPTKLLSSFGEKGCFTLPNRVQIRREPTLSITTLKSTRAGAHYDIEKFDDVVHEQNSYSAELNRETRRQWSLTLPLLNPGGYRDVIGTLYSYDSFYAPIIESQNITQGKRNPGWKVLVEAALKREPDKDLFRPEAIIFPERFCVDANEDSSKQNLQQIWRDDPDLFASQYMNDPLSVGSDQFSLPRLKSHVVDRRDIPSTVNLYMTWDLAMTTTEKGPHTHWGGADYSVGAVGGFSPNGSLFVIDIFRGRYRPAEIIEHIIKQYRRWPIIRVGIEKDLMTQMLAPGLESRQRQLGVYIPIDYIPIKRGKGNPESQILALGPLLEQDKLWFASTCNDLDETFREFSRFPKYQHDDIARAISLLVFYRQHGYRP